MSEYWFGSLRVTEIRLTTVSSTVACGGGRKRRCDNDTLPDAVTKACSESIETTVCVSRTLSVGFTNLCHHITHIETFEPSAHEVAIASST